MPKKRKQRTTYTKCLSNWGFSSDPFLGTFSPTKFWAGPHEQLDYLRYLLDDAAINRNVYTFLLSGNYGSGKTYHMRALQGYVMDELDGLGVYINFPEKVGGKGLQDILESFVESIGPNLVKEVGNNILEGEGIEDEEGFRLFLKELGIKKDLRYALSNIVFDAEFALTWLWLTGRATYWQKESLGLLSNPRDEPTALDILSGVIDFFCYKYSLVVIFMDELEHLRGESKAVRSIREGLRTLYDKLLYRERSKSVAFFFSVTARVLFELEDVLEVDRVDEEIHLKPLSRRDATHFVKDLFAHARDNADDGVVPPFENKAAFKRFIEISSGVDLDRTDRLLGSIGTPRRVIKLGKTLLRWSCAKSLKEIDAESLEKILVLRGT